MESGHNSTLDLHTLGSGVWGDQAGPWEPVPRRSSCLQIPSCLPAGPEQGQLQKPSSPAAVLGARWPTPQLRGADAGCAGLGGRSALPGARCLGTACALLWPCQPLSSAPPAPSVSFSSPFLLVAHSLLHPPPPLRILLSFYLLGSGH